MQSKPEADNAPQSSNEENTRTDLPHPQDTLSWVVLNLKSSLPIRDLHNVE